MPCLVRQEIEQGRIRQAHIGAGGIEQADARTISQGQMCAVEVFINAEHMSGLPALAERLAEPQIPQAAGRHRAIAQGRLRALEILPENEIDHPRHGISPINRRGAIGQNLYPVECRNRDQGQVDKIPDLGGRCQPGPVEQDERAA